MAKLQEQLLPRGFGVLQLLGRLAASLPHRDRPTETGPDEGGKQGYCGANHHLTILPLRACANALYFLHVEDATRRMGRVVRAEVQRISKQDRITAYQLALESLPGRNGWLTPLARRTDGASSAGILNTLEALRVAYQARIGAISDDESAAAVSLVPSGVRLNATTQEMVAALLLAIESLPQPAMWQAALSMRDDGTDPATVFAAIAELRMDLHIQIGDLQDSFRTFQ